MTKPTPSHSATLRAIARARRRDFQLRAVFDLPIAPEQQSLDEATRHEQEDANKRAMFAKLDKGPM